MRGIPPFSSSVGERKLMSHFVVNNTFPVVYHRCPSRQSLALRLQTAFLTHNLRGFNVIQSYSMTAQVQAGVLSITSGKRAPSGLVTA